MLSGGISVVDGCSAIASLARALNDAQIEEQVRFFIGAASEVDEFPTWATRHLWSPDAVAVQDQRAVEYSQRITSAVMTACVRLEDYLKADLA
jgi:hypothetical protein